MSLVWRPLLLLTGLVMAGLALQTLAGGDPSRVLASLAAGRNAASAASFVAVAALLCAVGVPRQIVAYAAGYAFGFWTGVALSLAAQLGACAADFGWARGLAGSWVRKMLGNRRRGLLIHIDGLLTETPFAATLTLRLLPVGSNLLLNLLAGVSAIPVLPFLGASAVGYLPQTVIFALVGSGVRVEQPIQLALGAGLFVAATGLGILLLRRHDRSKNPAEWTPSPR